MRVISGLMGREKVHYEAPDANRIPDEMSSFIAWFNESCVDPILKSALAHLRFVTIHPFEDGNGRLACALADMALADMALAQADGSPMRFYSITAEILKERARYYEILQETQKGGARRHELDSLVSRLSRTGARNDEGINPENAGAHGFLDAGE